MMTRYIMFDDENYNTKYNNDDGTGRDEQAKRARYSINYKLSAIKLVMCIKRESKSDKSLF